MAIAEYQIVKGGAATYSQLGYRLPGGQVPAVKLLEFLVIDREFSRARREAEKERLKR